MQKPTVDRAPNPGLDTPSARLIRAAGAGYRHAQRVQAAAYAAVAEAERLVPGVKGQEAGTFLDTLWPSRWEGLPAAIRAVAALLCHAEVIGCGGPLNLGGRERGTARAEWAIGLGKGRANASDGPAWTAAIEAAGWMLWDTALGLIPRLKGEPGKETPAVQVDLGNCLVVNLDGEILSLLLPVIRRLVLQQLPPEQVTTGLDLATPGIRSAEDGGVWIPVYDLVMDPATEIEPVRVYRQRADPSTWASVPSPVESDGEDW